MTSYFSHLQAFAQSISSAWNSTPTTNLPGRYLSRLLQSYVLSLPTKNLSVIFCTCSPSPLILSISLIHHYCLTLKILKMPIFWVIPRFHVFSAIHALVNDALPSQEQSTCPSFPGSHHKHTSSPKKSSPALSG